MIRYLAGGLTWLCLGSSVLACGGDYTVQAGETLSTIADRLYKDAGRWAQIHAGNRDVLGDDPEAVRAGQVLRLDCINGLPPGLPNPAVTAVAPIETETQAQDVEAEVVTRAPAVALSAVPEPQMAAVARPVRMLTGDAYRPLNQHRAERGGMLNEIMSAAMDTRFGAGLHATYWQTGYAAMFEPIMETHAVDVVFPVARPDCDAAPDTSLCRDYTYSEPLFEVLELLYVDSARPITFSSDGDLEGRTLCRPAGHQTHLLSPWLEAGTVELIQPDLVSECIFHLLAGEVDGLVLNEFTAREALAVMGITTRIVPVETRPLQIASLHAALRKDHPSAEDLVEKVNAGLQTLRDDGRYREIVGRHLDQIWAVK